MSRSYRRRVFAIAVTVIVVLLLLAAAVVLRVRAAPEAARLLPDCNGVLYANFKPVRQFTDFGKRPIGRAPEYLSFVEQTGFDPERDLDEVAFAIHSPSDSQHETRYSEVVIGRFNAEKLNDFLIKNARSRETYHDHEVFLIPYEDRIVRASVLSVDMVAVSNTGEAAQIDHIIDEFRRSALGSSGPRLLSTYYHDVPFGSVAWLITEVAPAQTMAFGSDIAPLSLVRQLFGGGVVVGSARYNGDLLLRAENFLKDESTAKARTEQLDNLLSLYKATETQTRPQNADADVEKVLNSIKVEQKADRVRVNVEIPGKLIGRLLEEPMEAQAPATEPAPQVKPKRRRHR